MFEGLFQPMHLLIILVIVLVIFGPGKLPEIGAALGKSIREFKQGTAEAFHDEPATAARPAGVEKGEERPH